MDKVLRIWGGSYHDYWFAEDAILKVRLVSQLVTIVGIVVLVALTALFGIVGIGLGALVAVLVYLLSGRLAKRRRLVVAELSVQEVLNKGLVTLRIPYDVISGAELNGERLTIVVEGRKVRVKVPQEYLGQLESLLRLKLGDNLLVSA